MSTIQAHTPWTVRRFSALTSPTHFLLCLLLFVACPAFATNYVVTAPHMTMHVGDNPPSCPLLVLNGTTSVGEGQALFTGSSTCSIGATTSSPVGTYTITINHGSLAPVSGSDSITFVDSTINVIASDGIGAKLQNINPYPSGFTSGPLLPMINVTSNPICNMVGDNGTDNSVCFQNLLAYGGYRARAGAIVNTSGTTVTVDNANFVTLGNMNFTTLVPGTNILINGTSYTVAAVTSSTVLVVTASAGTQSGVLMSVPTTVNTSGTTVTATNGISFTGMSGNILVNSVVYHIASVTDSTHIVTSTTLPTQTGVAFFAGTWANEFGRQALQLYFPNGIYLVKSQMQVFGNYWTMIGDGPQRSVIRLYPNQAAFNAGTSAVPFLNVPTTYYPGDNDNFREIFQNIGIRIGRGNPLAEAILWPSNNMGTMNNVEIWSEDSNATAGVVFEENPGPTLLKNVAISGFQQGLVSGSAAHQVVEYNATLDQITLEGQTTEGCNCSMNFSIQHLLSDNTVPAILDTGRMALLDSELLTTSTGVTGITVYSKGNQLYFKNVSCTGYSPCEVDNGTGTTVTLTTLPAEGWTGAAQTIFDSGSSAGSLAISDTETPIPTDPSVSTWTELGTDPTTWCASISGSASTTVYLPPGTYSSATNSININCTVPDTVNHIQMYNSQFTYGSSKDVVTFNVAGSSTTPLVIDGCMYGACQFNHTGTRTLVIRDTIGGYQAASGAGNVYFEDVGLSNYALLTDAGPGPTFYSGQLVTARQLDIETFSSSDPGGTSNPKIQCQGANLWILGYKTENDTPSLVETNQCQANVFGFFFYNLTLPDANLSPYYLTNSSLFATGFLDWNSANYGPAYWVQETRGTTSGTLAMPGIGNAYGQALNMFYSYGAHP